MKKRLLFSMLLTMLLSMLSFGKAAAAKEAYVHYDNNGTLTFYYDNDRDQRTGTTYSLNTVNDEVGWAEIRRDVTTVVFDPSFANARPSTTWGWFQGMNFLETIKDLKYLNTSQVKNMSSMFLGCLKLYTLDLSGFDTRNVTNMKWMFWGDESLTTIYVGSNWSTENVTSSPRMFLDCTSLVGGAGTTYDFNHTDAAYAHIDGGPDNPGYLTKQKEAYAEYADGTLTFHYDTNRVFLKNRTFDLNEGEGGPAWHFDPETGEEVDWYYDPDTGEETSLVRKVTAVVFDPSFAKARPTTCYGWFSGMTNLTTITGMKEYLNTSQVEHMSFLFANCSSLTSLDVSAFDTRNVKTMYAMFRNCSSLQTLDVTNFNTSRVTNMFCLFEGCSHLTGIDVSHFDTRNVTTMESMFENCWSLETLDLSAFDTHNVTSTMRMFIECQALTTIIVSDNWTMENVDMENYGSDLMFYDCYKLVGGAGTTYSEWRVDGSYAHIDGGPDDPGYLTGKQKEAYVEYTLDSNTMTFYYDNNRSQRKGAVYSLNEGENKPAWYDGNFFWSLAHVVFDPSFADARPTSCYKWFSEMEKLQSITGMKEYLNTSEVTSMRLMFCGCKSLKSIDVTGFDTRNVCNMSSMFGECKVVESLDLSSFDTQNVTNMVNMFAESEYLKTICVSDKWTTANVTESYLMFMGCDNLVGGAGTTYDFNHIDAAYAHIDGGPANPGYFTAAYLKGDVNNDGQVGIGDIVAITNVMAGIETDTGTVSRADVNGDTEVGIGDIVAVTNIMAGVQ